MQTNKRLFFAFWPSEKQRQTIESAISHHKTRLTGKWTSRDNWHVTLVFIGNFPDKNIAALQKAVTNIECPAIELRFEQIYYWTKPKIMCLQADFVPNQLIELVRSLQSTARAFGCRFKKRSYKAHMTIARGGQCFNPVSLAQPVELNCSSFHLVESVLTPADVQYKLLKQ
jgi:2'-5' RNA ligase